MDWNDYDAVLFDLDGVITPTADVHMRAWEKMFTEFLAGKHAAPYAESDYFDHIDGKPRYDGVRDMLASRDITLPEGDAADSSDSETVSGLGNRKNEVFAHLLADEGVVPFPGSVALVDALEVRGTPMAIVSSSRNAPAVLAAARMRDRFELVVDGTVAAEQGLAGKPAPDTYVYAAQQLGVPAERCVVFEDALSGVAAGRAGPFGLVIGVDRGAGAGALLAAGADIVVDDLAELVGE